jgi:cytochrome c oxidase subunit 4
MAQHAQAHAHPAAHGHVTPLGLYLAVFSALMVLTAVTVGVAFVHVGQLNMLIALGIACTKATLVVWFFMHVNHASRLTKLFVLTGVFFLAILIGLTMTDYGSRMWVNPPALLQ